jgi:hypothetical protein
MLSPNKRNKKKSNHFGSFDLEMVEINGFTLIDA